MVKPNANPADDTGLRQALHQRIDNLSGPALSAANQILQQIQLEQMAADLGRAFAEDWQAGRLSPEKIQQVIAEHRGQKPYGS